MCGDGDFLCSLSCHKCGENRAKKGRSAAGSDTTTESVTWARLRGWDLSRTVSDCWARAYKEIGETGRKPRDCREGNDGRGGIENRRLPISWRIDAQDGRAARDRGREDGRARMRGSRRYPTWHAERATVESLEVDWWESAYVCMYVCTVLYPGALDSYVC